MTRIWTDTTHLTACVMFLRVLRRVRHRVFCSTLIIGQETLSPYNIRTMELDKSLLIFIANTYGIKYIHTIQWSGNTNLWVNEFIKFLQQWL